MKRKIIFTSALALALAWSGGTTLAFSLPSYNNNVEIDSTGAVNVGNSGSNVKVNADGSVNVGNGGSSVDVTSDGSNVNVNSGGNSVNVSSDENGQNVNITTADGKNTINVSGQNGVMDVQVNGQNVQLRADKGGLSVQVKGDFSDSEKEAVVSLMGGSDILIQTEADLEAYADLVEEFRPGIKQVLVNNNKVMVKYDQPGKFLWFKKSSLNATAEVDADGNVEI